MKKPKTEYIKEAKAQEKVTLQEVKVVIRTLKNRKALRYNKITIDMLNKIGETRTIALLEIHNKAWSEEQILKDWQKALMVLNTKKVISEDAVTTEA